MLSADGLDMGSILQLKILARPAATYAVSG